MSVDPPLYDPSPAVLRILARRYGDKWIGTAETGTPIFETIMPPPDLFATAVAAGVMFTEPRVLDHDGWIGAARQAAAAVTPHEVGDAFLASLTSRRLDLRSALASYALTRHLPDHSYAERQRGVSCAVCGISRGRDGTVDPEDLNSFSQIRFGSGGFPGDVKYAAFDLEQFTRAPRLAPTAADISLGQQIIDYLRQLPPKTTAAQGSPELLEAVPRHETSHASLLAAIVDVMRGSSAATGNEPSTTEIEQLSPSELRVLRYLPTNLSRPEIASELSVSVNTVNTHIRNIYAKLQAQDRSSAVRRARERRLLSAGPHS